MTSESTPSISYSRFMFEEHSVSRGGFLPDFETGAHACWYYCIVAHTHMNRVDEGATYDGELDIGPALNNIARSVATQYGFDDPSDMLRFMPVVMKEAERMKMGFDVRVLTPGNHKFQYSI